MASYYLYTTILLPSRYNNILSLITVYTVRKEMKCRGDSEILHEIVRDTSRKSEKHELILEVSQTVSCSILESPIRFIFFSNNGCVHL